MALSTIERAAARLNQAKPRPTPATGQPSSDPDSSGAETPDVSGRPAPGKPVNLRTIERLSTEGPAGALRTLKPVVADDQQARIPTDERAAVEPTPEPDTTQSVTIDLHRLERRGFISPLRPVTRMSEEMRLVKRPLLRTAFANPDPAHLAQTKDNVIMVTSANPREGKTFVSINLAISLAIERDIHVMLIDADVIRPCVFSTLDLEPSTGLIDVLEEPDMNLSQVIVRTNIGKLSLMSAGKSHMLTSELLASDRMGQLIEEMASRYPDRIIIFDTPPLLAASEPSVLAHRVGQVLVVVQADRTGEGSLHAALDLVSDCPRVRMLLNKASPFFAGFSFGSYYADYRRSKR